MRIFRRRPPAPPAPKKRRGRIATSEEGRRVAACRDHEAERVLRRCAACPAVVPMRTGQRACGERCRKRLLRARNKAAKIV